MNLVESQQELSELVCEGLVAGEKRARMELASEALYAVTLYSASGFQGLGVAVNTKEQLERIQSKLAGLSADLLEMLSDHPDLLAMASDAPEPEPEVWACEWEHIYSHLPDQQANLLIDRHYQYFYDNQWEPNSISKWFLEAILAGIQSFSQQPQSANDLLLGLQFSDPSLHEIEMIEWVSQAVNSPTWHAKVQKACAIARRTK